MATTKGQTSLTSAIFGGSYALVKLLLRHRPDLVHHKLAIGLTPLQMAERWGHTKIAAAISKAIEASTSREMNGGRSR